MELTYPEAVKMLRYHVEVPMRSITRRMPIQKRVLSRIYKNKNYGQCIDHKVKYIQLYTDMIIN